MYDIVYKIRNDEPLPHDGLELRYSLRSVAKNLPHDRVVLLGGCPSWATGVVHIPHDDPRDKWLVLMGKYGRLRDLGFLSPVVYMMSDDVYVTQPVTSLAPLRTCTLQERIVQLQSRARRNRYRDGFVHTLEALRREGIHNPVNHDLHVPQVLERAAVPEWLGGGRSVLAPASAIANRQDLVSERPPKDWKVISDDDMAEWRASDAVFLSSREDNFLTVGVADYLAEILPEPSRYEK